jgi:hypothetical protein
MSPFDADRLYAAIVRDAKEIMAAAEAGNARAKRVIDLHRMCVRSADVPTVSLLDAAYSDYVKHRESTNAAA